MRHLTSTKMIELFDKEYQSIVDSTEGKSEYERLREAYFRGLMYYAEKFKWHDANEEKVPIATNVLLRVIPHDRFHIPVYSTSVDDLEETFTCGYTITHWQEMLPWFGEENKSIFHVEE